MSTPNNLLPFSIEAWKERKDDVVTRDGRRAIVAAYNENAKTFQKFAGWIDGKIASWSLHGLFDIEESANDLFMLPETRVFYQNVGINGLGPNRESIEACEAWAANCICIQRVTLRGKEVTTEIVHRYD